MNSGLSSKKTSWCKWPVIILSVETSKQYGKFHVKVSKLGHDVGFSCHKTTKVNVCEVLYHSMALNTAKLGIYSYPHYLAVLSRNANRQREKLPYERGGDARRNF